ncbi:MAG: response regulator transcription factor [Ruminococcus flavefaciens]|nr:response regulator transcription factor [Ruminococcus flavefaciens]
MEKSKILIVDDDSEIRELIDALLTGEGYSIRQASDGKQALSIIDSSFDLVILDIMMPEMSGYKVCSEIRENYNTPILFLTAKSMDSDLTMGFSVGGDDYLTKPFSFSELLARVKGLLRRYHTYNGKSSDMQDEYYIYGTLNVHSQFNQVLKDGTELNLTEIEYQILKKLIAHRGRIFTMQNLYENVWNEPYFSTSANTVMAHIRKLRVKIENNPQKPEIIKTVWGKGYRIE